MTGTPGAPLSPARPPARLRGGRPCSWRLLRPASLGSKQNRERKSKLCPSYSFHSFWGGGPGPSPGAGEPPGGAAPAPSPPPARGGGGRGGTGSRPRSVPKGRGLGGDLWTPASFTGRGGARRPALSLEVAVGSAPLPSPPPLVTQRPVTCASGGTRSAPPRAQGTDTSDFTAASRHLAERTWRVSKLSAEPADEARAVPEPAHRQMRPGGSSCPLRFPRFGSDCPGRVTRAVRGVSRSRREREVVPVPRPSGPGRTAPGAASETFCSRSPGEDGAGSRGLPWTLPAGWDEPTLSFGESQEEPSSPVDTRETGCWLLRPAFRVLHFPDPPKSHLVGRRIKISGSRPVSLCGAWWEHGQHPGSGRLTRGLCGLVSHTPSPAAAGRPPLTAGPFQGLRDRVPRAWGGIWNRWGEARRVDDELMQKRGNLQGQDPRGVGAALRPPLRGDPRPNQRNWHFFSPSAQTRLLESWGLARALGT